MSFINLMANDVWSETDIVARTEALIHSQFSLEHEGIINRKATGAALGQYTLTPDEVTELGAYAACAEAARAEGNAARADMTLLLEVLGVEAARRRLAQPESDPMADGDATERAAAQATITTASQASLGLVALRNPAPAVAA